MTSGATHEDPPSLTTRQGGSRSAPPEHIRFSRFRVGLALAMIAAFLTVPAGPASAVSTCQFLVDTALIAMTSGGSAVVGVDLAPSPDAILFDDDSSLAGASQCGPADVVNTNRIVVTGGVANDRFVIDLSNGRFQPHNDFQIDLLAGSDTLVIAGAWEADLVVFGQAGIDLDGDAGADVTSPTPPGVPGGVEHFQTWARGGNDAVLAAGGSGTGASFPRSLLVLGGPGHDTFVGTNAGDRFSGGGGRDQAKARGGRDILNGNPQSDRLSGGRGRDLLRGGSGADVCRGGPGNDVQRSC